MLAVYRWDLPGNPKKSDYFVVDLREDCDHLLVRLSEVVGCRWEPIRYHRGYWEDRVKDSDVSRVS